MGQVAVAYTQKDDAIGSNKLFQVPMSNACIYSDSLAHIVVSFGVVQMQDIPMHLL